MDQGATPYSLTVERKDRYLHVRVSGENTPETVSRYVAETIAACREHGARRVLVEEHLTGPSLSQMTMLDIITDGIGGAGPPALDIAYVDVNPEHDFSRLHFAETAARNRGYLFHLFPTVPDAEAWLASG